MKHTIVIENTLYSLLLFWLIKNVNNITYILEGTDLNKSLIDKLKEKNDVYLFYQHFNKPKIYRFFSVYFVQKIHLYFFIKNKLKDNYLIYGNDDLIAFDIFRKFDYFVLEDGLTNYRLRDKGIKKNLFLKYFKCIIRGDCKHKSFGRSEKCKKIYLTGISQIPSIIANKVELVNLKQLWRAKSQEEKMEILRVFCITDEIIKNLKTKKVILLTQPISNEIISEEEKIKIYRKCLLKYKVNDIAIKVHPKEKTNYKNYFPNIMIIDTPFPFELINLLEVKINKVITLFSAAALTLGDDIEVEWLGAGVHKKLFEHYGETLDLKNIQKSNNVHSSLNNKGLKLKK